MQEFLSFEDFTNNKCFCAVSTCCVTGRKTLICYDEYLHDHCVQKLIVYFLNNYIYTDGNNFKIKYIKDKEEFELYSRSYDLDEEGNFIKTEEFDKTEVFKIIIANHYDFYDSDDSE
jgi:hypothetical protein